MHAMAHEITQHIVLDGARSQIPAAAFVVLKRKLSALHREDSALFLDLTVLFAKLKAGGLVVVAQQLLALAEIGAAGLAMDNTLDGLAAFGQPRGTLVGPKLATPAKRQTKRMSLVELLTACPDEDMRTELVIRHVHGCSLDEKLQLLSLINEDALLFVLQFASGKHTKELAQAAVARGVPKQRLLQLCDGARLPSGRSLHEAIGDLNQ